VIANSAFLAAMIVLLLLFYVMGAVEFLAPYKHLIVPYYLWPIVSAIVIVFVHVFALSYLLARTLFLKDTGRKLAHVEKQLQTADTIARDLSDRLAGEE
jgi:hypothetical protein